MDLVEEILTKVHGGKTDLKSQWTLQLVPYLLVQLQSFGKMNQKVNKL